MNTKEKYSKWMFIAFPAISMLLGWGLRGYIGGGPYGAMIPGAMVALSISVLLDLPPASSAILMVLGVVGIGLGGEMTYGQTLGFLRNPDSVWWGTVGTTVKGGIWGLLGGAVFSLGLIHKRISKKILIYVFVILIVAMFVGFKLINDPMIIYFSDRAKPRPESWGALLLGALAILLFLRLKSDKNDHKITLRFALWGMIGGALGFGLGGFWLVMGSHLPDVIFKNWWKAMEFSFGLLFGAALGYATWLSRKEAVLESLKEPESAGEAPFPVWKEWSVVLLTGLLIFWLIPNSIEWFTQTAIDNNMPGGTIRNEIARLADNYSLSSLIFVLVLVRFPKSAWQIGITLTFCRTVMDLFKHFYQDVNFWSPFTMHFFWVLSLTAIVALLTTYFSRRKNLIRNMFLLLTWSTVAVAFLNLTRNPEIFKISGLSVCEIVCGRFFVHIVFSLSALFVTWILCTKYKETELN